MEIKAEKKYTPQELADRCLREFQTKEPDKGYWACTPVKEKTNHFVLLGSASGLTEVRWDPEYHTFVAVNKDKAEETKEKKSETPAKQPEIIHVELHNVAGTKESKFDGTVPGMIGYYLVAAVITICTLSIAYPWMLCMIKRWETRHTVIEGRRLYFDGTGSQLIGRWILWILLLIVTIGIYGFWIPIQVRKWTVKHTHFEV